MIMKLKFEYQVWDCFYFNEKLLISFFDLDFDRKNASFVMLKQLDFFALVLK